MRSVNLILTAAAFGMLSLATPATVNAGPNETQFLQNLVGTWSGRGEIRGNEAGTMTCRLTLKPAGSRLNYNGRCAYSGGSSPQSFSGRISYNERTGEFESTSRGRTVAGDKSGSTLVFTMTSNDSRAQGTSTLKLSPSAISVTFNMLNARNGERSQGSIPFTRA